MKKAVLTLILLLCISLPVAAGLEGKVIVINPGHGGGETGAVGLNGLVERDINLKVGLYLRDMLEEAGAIVYMTRTENVDLDGTNYYSGTRDRFNRLAVGREKEADVFLALHHNASVNREANQIEVYYMPKYHGPSKDLAEYLTEGLKETMELGGIATTMSQLVVNHATIPTIIGEASYISNPEIEKWLSDDANLKKQAEGYFIGLQRFFEFGMPVATALTPSAYQKVPQELPIIVAKITNDGVSPINPETVQVRIDNKVIPHDFDAATGVLTAKAVTPLENGPHKLLVIGRNEAGIAAVPVDFTFYVDEKPAKIVLDTFPTYVPAETVVKISGQVVDNDGQPVLDGTQVYFEIEYDGTMQDQWVFTRGGHFVSYMKPTTNPEVAGLRIWTADILEEIAVDFRSKMSHIAGTVVNFETGQPLVGVEVALKSFADGSTKTVQTDRDGGFFFAELEPENYKVTMEKPGYESWQYIVGTLPGSIDQLEIRAIPIAGGALMNRKIILNMAVEGTVAGAQPVLDALKAKLERAGAVVTLVTEGADDTAVVKGTNKLMGNFLLSVKLTEGDKGLIYHYPKSEKYQAVAKTLVIEGLTLGIEESRSKLITFANTQSFIVELPAKAKQADVVEGLYAFLAQYFQGVK